MTRPEIDHTMTSQASIRTHAPSTHEIPAVVRTGAARIEARLAPLRSRLVGHEVYRCITDIGALRIFMEHHVFAVFDFMSLLSALRGHCVAGGAAWHPRGDASVRRFLNEILAVEDADEDGRGGHASHFEIYLDAMLEAGADVTPILACVEAVRDGRSVPAAIESSGAPEGARRFSLATFSEIEAEDPLALAGAFTFGREEIIPAMFRRMVSEIGRTSEHSLGRFLYYLDRHIQVDGDDHGPMAMRMLDALAGDDAARWERIGDGAERALLARVRFWDDIAAVLAPRSTASRG